jgi:hypothetical protein
VTWTQTENPFSIYDTKATVTNFSLTLNGENYTYNNDNVFAGLSVSSSSYTLLDGNVVNGWWWYSVGNNKAHLASANKINGNPGVIPYSATLSELYICQPKETANTSTTTATITTATITPETGKTSFTLTRGCQGFNFCATTSNELHIRCRKFFFRE